VVSAKRSVPDLLLDLDTQALDFLVQRGKRDEKTLCGFGLVPVGTLEHVNDDAALDFVHDLKQRRLWTIRRGAGPGLSWKRWEKLRELQAHAAHDFLASNALREQVHVNTVLRREHDGEPY